MYKIHKNDFYIPLLKAFLIHRCFSFIAKNDKIHRSGQALHPECGFRSYQHKIVTIVIDMTKLF